MNCESVDVGVIRLVTLGVGLLSHFHVDVMTSLQAPRHAISARCGKFAMTLWFAKILADFGINNIDAFPPLFCYNS